MFERYNQRARRVLFFARYEASALGWKTIEPFHILLGLVREAPAVTRELLLEAADPLDDLVKEIKGHILTGPWLDTSIEIPFSESTKRVLVCAVTEADALSHREVGPEHLLLGLLRGEDSVAAAILYGRGMRVERVRAKLSSGPTSVG
jgi:ATP-dependent Clp protease ATP-binding subunit ClpC